MALGNYWWETIDYANHQSSLNGFQAVLDDDGVFRAVVSARDPGVANWLDTAGHGQRADDLQVAARRLPPGARDAGGPAREHRRQPARDHRDG